MSNLRQTDPRISGTMQNLPDGFKAIVFGASGGIGSAFCEELSANERCGYVAELSRRSTSRIDLEDESTIAAAAEQLKATGPFHLMIDATGILHDGDVQPEKSLSAIDPAHVARVMQINATGPLLLLKHFSALMPRDERSVFATLSARVGSISDNQLGGWYSYRASKAALNMMLKTASIEIKRKRPLNVCLALHPGTVATGLSDPFAGSRDRLSPQESARRLLQVIDGATLDPTGSFLAYDGSRIEW